MTIAPDAMAAAAAASVATPAVPDPVLERELVGHAGAAQVGTVAPEFTTRNQHGQFVTLSELRGAPVVIVFFPFAFTGICTGELAAVQDSLAAFTAAGARVLAVSTDTMFTLRVFAEQQGLEFDLLSDHWPHGGIASAYGVFDSLAGCALRGSFVLDAAGVITWAVLHQISDPRDIADHLAAVAG